MRVSVIIPTYNEAQAIGRVLADLPSDLVTEVIVVDSNSSDRTPEIAAEKGARVVKESRRGYGRACLTGIANANTPDVFVFLDGDYSDRPSELPILLAPILEGRADITLGSRLGADRNSGALPWHQAFGNRLAAGMIRLFYGVKISDLGPFRAARADVLHALLLKEDTYGWAVEIILKGALAGFRIIEVPVSYHPRIGKSKISGTVKGTIGAAWFILSRIVRYISRVTGPERREPSRNQSCMESHHPNLLRSATQDFTLVIMAKAPKPGMVKTRLSQSLPSAAITSLYCCLLEDTVALTKLLKGVEVAVMCPESDKQELAQFLGSSMPVVAQKGEGLAAGLNSVFAHFTAAGRQRVIAFNSDSPHLPVPVLEQAFEILSRHDVVVGPTNDGGYYLVGANTAHPTLFENDGLGTSSALERLLARARVLELSIGLTEPFYDIDVADDLIRLAPELQLAPAKAPRTAAWFAEWGQAVEQMNRVGEQ